MCVCVCVCVWQFPGQQDVGTSAVHKKDVFTCIMQCEECLQSIYAPDPQDLCSTGDPQDLCSTGL